jgi:hypothetical protein
MLLSSITAAAAAYTSPLAPASDLFVNFESVLVVAIRALAMVAQSADVSGRLTLLALSCTAQLLRSAERIEISTSSSDGVFALAVTAAGTARFELVDAASDELVYHAIVDVLSICAVSRLSSPRQDLSEPAAAAPAGFSRSSYRIEAALALFRMSIDAPSSGMSRSVQMRAASVLMTVAPQFARSAIAMDDLPNGVVEHVYKSS